MAPDTLFSAMRIASGLSNFPRMLLKLLLTTEKEAHTKWESTNSQLWLNNSSKNMPLENLKMLKNHHQQSLLLQDSTQDSLQLSVLSYQLTTLSSAYQLGTGEESKEQSLQLKIKGSVAHAMPLQQLQQLSRPLWSSEDLTSRIFQNNKLLTAQAISET